MLPGSTLAGGPAPFLNQLVITQMKSLFLSHHLAPSLPSFWSFTGSARTSTIKSYLANAGRSRNIASLCEPMSGPLPASLGWQPKASCLKVPGSATFPLIARYLTPSSLHGYALGVRRAPPVLHQRRRPSEIECQAQTSF